MTAHHVAGAHPDDCPACLTREALWDMVVEHMAKPTDVGMWIDALIEVSGVLAAQNVKPGHENAAVQLAHNTFDTAFGTALHHFVTGEADRQAHN